MVREFCYGLLVCELIFGILFFYELAGYGRESVVDIFGTTMDGSLVIMEGNMLLIFFLLQWMVALALWKVVCCSDF